MNARRRGPRSLLANSGLVLTVTPDAFGHDPRGGLRLQRRMESRAWELAGGAPRAQSGARQPLFHSALRHATSP